MKADTYYAVYELDGASLAAAKELLNEVDKQYAITPAQKSGVVNDIRDSWNVFYDCLINRLRVENPAILDKTGLNHTIVQMRAGGPGYPRAYAHTPEIFTTPEKNERYIMYAPIDYKGDHFKPEGGKLFTEKQADQIGLLLFAGGWLGNAPIISARRYGVATPHDFDQNEHRFMPGIFNAAADGIKIQCFEAKGESLCALKKFAKAEAAFKKQCDMIQSKIKDALEQQFPTLLKNLPDGEGLYINQGRTQGGGRPIGFEFSIRRDGKTGLMQAGQPINPLPSPHFETVACHSNWHVAPRTDTKEGRAFAKLIKALPQNPPSLGDYPELGAPAPQLHTMNNRPFLIYRSPSQITPPTGALPVDMAEYLWLRQDEEDRNMGINPPPAPDVLRHLYAHTKKPTPPTPKATP